MVVDETGLSLAALNGFPGPLVKWMLESVGARGIARIADAFGDLRATASCALIYRDVETEVVALGETTVRLVLEPRGAGGFGWDPIFVPEEGGRTYAEMPSIEKDRIGHRSRAWRRLQRLLG